MYACAMIDGNTELMVRGWDRGQMSARMLGLFRHIDENTEETARVIVIRRPWVEGEQSHEALPVSCAWRSGRARARVYHVEVPGCWHLTFNERYSTAKVQLAASMLWSVGYSHAARWTIAALHQEIFGALSSEPQSRYHALRYDAPLVGAADAGWRVSRAEICTDLAHYPIDTDSVHLGFRGKATMFGVDTVAGTCETLSLGGPSSAVRLRIYDKILECRSGDDTTWKYEQVWRRNGWNPGGPVYRVEIVLQEHGLEIESTEGQIGIDLTRPEALADPDQIARAWAFHTFKKRRIRLTATRRERCETHPHWLEVIGAPIGAEAFRPLSYRQRRAAQASACDTMTKRDTASAINAALRYAAREIGISSTVMIGGDWDDPLYDSDGSPIVSIERTAAATRHAAQLALEAMLANATDKELMRKSAYIERYAAIKRAELAEEMAMRASRYVPPPELLPAWERRKTHRDELEDIRCPDFLTHGTAQAGTLSVYREARPMPQALTADGGSSSGESSQAKLSERASKTTAQKVRT